MFTVKQVATALQISNTLLRQRGGEYAAYLSDSANPGKGETRRYTEDDIAVLQTVGVLKSQGKSDNEIQEALAAGDRMEPVDMPQPEKKSAGKDDKALVTSEFAAALQSYETQVSSLQKKNDELHDRLLEMTERAIRAETKNEAVSILGDAETPAAVDVQSQGESWRVRLSRWIGGGEG